MKRAPLQLRHPVPLFRLPADCERTAAPDKTPLRTWAWIVAGSLVWWFIALCVAWWIGGVIYPGS